MFNYYSIGFLFQAFCLYHAFNHKVEYYWYFIILFIPILGVLAYLYVHFYSQRNVDNLSENVKTAFVSNYKIEQLEKTLSFSDTTVNRVQLADQHLIQGNFARAKELYLASLHGIYAGDPSLLQKLLMVHFSLNEYEDAVRLGAELKNDPLFANSEDRIAYAWSLHYMDDNLKAEKEFKGMDVRFSNYVHRIEYAKFRNEIQDFVGSKIIIENLLEEVDSMDTYEKRLKKEVINEIKSFHKTLAKV